MFAKILVVVFLATAAFAEIPSYMKICGRKNPNLSQCALNSAEGLREKFKTGMPEIGAPPLEPLYLEGFPIYETEQLRSYMRNVKISGLTDYVVKNMKIDLEKNTIDVGVTYRKVIIEADYDVITKIIMPIEGHGPIKIQTVDVDTKAAMKYKLIKKNEKEYMFFPSMTTSLNIADYEVDFKPEDGPGRETLLAAFNAALDGGRQEILATIRPTIEKVISREVLKLVNKITTHFTYDELFPDHE